MYLCCCFNCFDIKIYRILNDDKIMMILKMRLLNVRLIYILIVIVFCMLIVYVCVLIMVNNIFLNYNYIVVVF